MWSEKRVGMSPNYIGSDPLKMAIFFHWSIWTKEEWVLGPHFHCIWHSLKQEGKDFTIPFYYKVA